MAEEPFFFYFSQRANVSVIAFISLDGQFKKIVCSVAFSLSMNICVGSLLWKYHCCNIEKKIFCHGFYCAEEYIFFYLVNVVLRSVYSWQSVMTTTCKVMTSAVRWFGPPPSADNVVRNYSAVLNTGGQDSIRFGRKFKKVYIYSIVKVKLEMEESNIPGSNKNQSKPLKKG